jgi:mono/diheme cytochrome c family protein
MRDFLAAAVLAGGCLLSGCGSHLLKMNSEQPVVRPDQIVSFDRLYGENCSACHGSNGQGGPALDLNNPALQQLLDDETLRHAIHDGVAGTLMPAFGESAGGMLTDAQVDALMKGIRARWATAGTVRPSQMPTEMTTLTGNAARGQEIYQTDCSSCHRGARQQVTDPTYLALVSDPALRTILIAGRPDVGHPGWQTVAQGHAASDQELTDVVAYLASLRSTTPGQPYAEQSQGEASAAQAEAAQAGAANGPAATKDLRKPTTGRMTEPSRTEK